MMTPVYKGNIGYFAFDPRTKIYFGRLFNICDVVTFKADSLSGVHQSFKDSVDDYLEFTGEDLIDHALRICHHHQLTDKEGTFICRGALLRQCDLFHGMGFLSEPTIEAWDVKCIEMSKPEWVRGIKGKK